MIWQRVEWKQKKLREKMANENRDLKNLSTFFFYVPEEIFNEKMKRNRNRIRRDKMNRAHNKNQLKKIAK